jgi:hypothetical protein
MRAVPVGALPHMGSAMIEGRVNMGAKIIITFKILLDGHARPDCVPQDDFNNERTFLAGLTVAKQKRLQRLLETYSDPSAASPARVGAAGLKCCAAGTDKGGRRSVPVSPPASRRPGPELFWSDQGLLAVFVG